MSEQKSLVAPVNALAAFTSGRNFPQLSLDGEIQRLVGLYGKAQVRDALKRLPATKKGRKPLQDWKDMQSWITQDAIDWLDGKDPLAERSNYSIAKDIAKKHPGHASVSTHRRLMRKLSEGRHRICVLAAWDLSEKQRPFSDYFRACDAVCSLNEKWRDLVQDIADRQRGMLERYRDRFGDPDPALSIKDIEEALKTPPPLPPKINALGFLGRAVR